MSIKAPCYHCSLQSKHPVYAEIAGKQQAFCCSGCRVIAEVITENGLVDYYNQRTTLPAQKTLSNQNKTSNSLFKSYEHPEIKATFVNQTEQGYEEATLLIEGIQCAACVWLLEQYILQQPGIKSVCVALDNQRAQICWDPKKNSISQLFSSIDEIGYKPHPYHTDKAENLLNLQQRQLLVSLGISGLGLAQVMIYAIALYSGFFQGIAPVYVEMFRWISLFITTPVVIWGAKPLYQSAFRNLKSGFIGMDIPIVTAITIAYCASAWHTFTGEGEVYFDSTTMFIFFVILSRFLERKACYQAESASHALLNLLPPTVEKIANNIIENVPIHSIKVGHRLIVKSGDRVPVDGVVVSLEGQIDESTLTGESHTVAKITGNRVYAGTLNIGQPLEVKVTRIANQTVLSSIIRLIEKAKHTKPKTLEWIDYFSKYWVIALTIISVLTYGYWSAENPSEALTITLAVLVISCPCALSVATPAAITVAIGQLQRIGFLVLRPHIIKNILDYTDIIFDKTGTLTRGNLELLEIKTFKDNNQSYCLAIAKSLESCSEHIIAKSLLAYANENDIQNERVLLTDIKHYQAKGIEGTLCGEKFRIGQNSFVSKIFSKGEEEATFIPDCNQIEQWVLLGNSKGPMAWFRFSDNIRKQANELVLAIKDAGKTIHILTGDQRSSALPVAQALGITNLKANATPADKLTYIENLQKQGKRVIMVGDGLNDLPVLAKAHASIAMQHASSLAHTHSDAIITHNDFTPMLNAFKLAKRARAIIKQNLFWALTYNIICIPLAAFGYVPPYLAAIGMSISTLLVVSNALRLRSFLD